MILHRVLIFSNSKYLEINLKTDKEIKDKVEFRFNFLLSIKVHKFALKGM